MRETNGFRFWSLLAPLAVGAQDDMRPSTLPATAVKILAASLDAARSHKTHEWRDTPPTNSDGTVNAYIEIARGDLRKWEFDMRANRRAIDRMIPTSIGGYPVNYGFVPQTVSYDGDPFDALVLGPPLPDGRFVAASRSASCTWKTRKASTRRSCCRASMPRDGRCIS